MHTDHTLKIFDQLTVRIGTEFRTFNNKTCPAFKTKELSREVDARKRRQLKKTGTKGKSVAASVAPMVDDEDGPLSKNFNIQTYKHHALGDYPKMIQKFGTNGLCILQNLQVFLLPLLISILTQIYLGRAWAPHAKS